MTRNKLFAVICVCVSAITGAILAELILRQVAPQVLEPSFFVTLPSGSYFHLPSTTHTQKLQNREIEIKINQQGLRSSKEVEFNKPTDEYRILGLGDSFTFGWLVDEKDAFISRFENLIQTEFSPKKISLLNAGHPGYGTQTMLAYLEEKGLQLQPNMVILFFGPGDIDRNAGFQLYSLEDGEVTRKVNQAPSTTSVVKRKISENIFYRWMCEHSHLFQLMRKGGVRLIIALQNLEYKRSLANFTPPTTVAASVTQEADAPLKFDAKLFELSRALLKRIQKICMDKGIPLIVVPVGVSHGLTTQFLSIHRDWWKQEGFNIIDVSDDMLKATTSDTDLFIPGDGHYSPKGHLYFTELVWPKLSVQLHNAMILQ